MKHKSALTTHKPGAIHYHPNVTEKVFSVYTGENKTREISSCLDLPLITSLCILCCFWNKWTLPQRLPVHVHFWRSWTRTFFLCFRLICYSLFPINSLCVLHRCSDELDLSFIQCLLIQILFIRKLQYSMEWGRKMFSSWTYSSV